MPVKMRLAMGTFCSLNNDVSYQIVLKFVESHQIWGPVPRRIQSYKRSKLLRMFKSPYSVSPIDLYHIQLKLYQSEVGVDISIQLLASLTSKCHCMLWWGKGLCSAFWTECKILYFELGSLMDIGWQSDDNTKRSANRRYKDLLQVSYR